MNRKDGWAPALSLCVIAGLSACGAQPDAPQRQAPDALAGEFLVLDGDNVDGRLFYAQGRFESKAMPTVPSLADELLEYPDVPFDACQLDTLTAPAADDEVRPWNDAGAALTVARGSAQALLEPTEILLTPYYATAYGAPFDFVGDREYRLAGPGGKDIGAFDVTIHAPERVSVTTPVLSEAQRELPVRRDEALQLAWDPGTRGDVFARIQHFRGAQTDVLVCRFADDGQAEIPAALLAQMEPSPIGAELPDTLLDVFKSDWTTFEPPGAAGPVLVRFQSAWYTWALLQE